MKILHINASDIGSTGKIIQGISRQATRRGWDSVALFPRRNREPDSNMKEYIIAHPLEQGVYRRICGVYGLRYGCAPLSTAKTMKIISKEQPDVVHLHSINCFCVDIYRLLAYLKKKGIATVVTNHAEFFYTGNCAHAFTCDKWKTGCGKCGNLFAATDSKLFDRTHTAWKKMKRAFQRHPNIHIVSVSPWVYSRSTESPILAGLPQSTVLNGVNCAVFKGRDMRKAREELGIPLTDKVIVHATANFSDSPTDMKGGRYLLKLARLFQGENVRFLVAGKNHIEGELPDNVTLLGEIRDQDRLARYYAAADLVAVFSKRETFGMTVAEALCCGTPVVGFESGGSESIALKEYSCFVPFGDVVSMEASIRDKWLNMKTTHISNKIADKAIEKYSAEVMAINYCDIYQKIIEKEEFY